MMMTSLGVIETRGLTSAVQAADAACKSAAVNLAGYKKIGSGLVSVMFHGEISAVSAAVESGVAAAQDVVASLVLARPDESVLAMLENTTAAQLEPVVDADGEPAPKADNAVQAKAQLVPEVLAPSDLEKKPEPEQKPESTTTQGPEIVALTEPKQQARSVEVKPVEEKPATSAKATGAKPAAKRSTRTRRQGTRQ
ncbi:BMC domain-containing protein [Photobacterium atrarenae]|uniref:BMC domain-containing protein n=1 Tax=Photobacterium atrarenae TaxID=865757 RepID=UPI003F6FD899